MGPFEGASNRANVEVSESSTCEQTLLVSVLARVLQRLIDINSSNALRSTPCASGGAIFDSSSCPPISILAYLARIQKYAKCSDSCFIVALIYVDRLIELRNIVLTSLNIHRIIITSILLATKSLDDVSYNNSFYAKLGGISPLEINLLECEFLHLVSFTLFVLPESYDKYCGELKTFSFSISCSSFNYRDEEKTCHNSMEHSYFPPQYSQLNQSLFSVPPSSTINANMASTEMYTDSYFSSKHLSSANYFVPHMNPHLSSKSVALSPSRLSHLASYYHASCYPGLDAVYPQQPRKASNECEPCSIAPVFDTHAFFSDHLGFPIHYGHHLVTCKLR